MSLELNIPKRLLGVYQSSQYPQTRGSMSSLSCLTVVEQLDAVEEPVVYEWDRHDAGHPNDVDNTPLLIQGRGLLPVLHLLVVPLAKLVPLRVVSRNPANRLVPLPDLPIIS